ncbi:SGNH/GDSL hydrolase family protein [Paenibacillus physcomitrellae]|uniref:SGNH hydrolase-type esterase domain-containing protein n=1 Tax=Paenibacillus physcomitrellae TaxID=1619311 RepID=A0ABQ1FVS4_9BACL|nr:SGNH/GDSL hydrolase family protein [Paenibacillus physcomitrellae]GGA30379.1 hypothetical protein GCM10010917_14400 [Paenibacillus physcomitrellae]
MENEQLNRKEEMAAAAVWYGSPSTEEEIKRGKEGSGFQLRGGLPYTQNKIRLKRPVRIAFLGGSITEGAGASQAEDTSWRALTGQYLSERLGGEMVSCVNAGVGGTNSVFGAHRLYEHVLSQRPIDLLFVEFSVNDGNDQLEQAESIRGMEGIVRQMKRLSPQTDLCFVYTASERNLSSEMPKYIAVHEHVAEHYHLSSVNFARKVYDLLQEEDTEWTDLAPDTYHPNDAGHALYAEYMKEYLDRALFGESTIGDVKEEEAVPEPIEESNYEYAGTRSVSNWEEGRGHLPARREEGGRNASTSDVLVLPIPRIRLISRTGWKRSKLEANEPLMNWRYDTEHLFTEQEDADLTFEAWGQSAGVTMLYGPDSGIFEFSINGGTFVEVNLFDEWCPLAYRPVSVLFPIQTERGPMTITLRNTGRRDQRSRGTRLMILRLLVN